MLRRVSPRGTMTARSWLLVLCFGAVCLVQEARAQPDSKGFISIDCGLQTKTTYAENTTITYTSDDGFTDGGSNHNVSQEYITPSLSRRYYNVRSFPDGARNCYTVRSLVAGIKYIVRATFMYGNHDGLNKQPVFDLHIGANVWTTVNMTRVRPGDEVTLEAIVVVPDDFVQVCLVNTGAGTPFISGLDLRPLENRVYPQANATQGLVLFRRANFGATEGLVRYPDDPHDRFWYVFPSTTQANWKEISTTLRVNKLKDDLFDPPSAVMQTAITPRNASGNIEFYWESEPQPNDATPGFITILHFAELELLPPNASREFYINRNDRSWFSSGSSLEYLTAVAVCDIQPLIQHWYNISINATANSTLPPLLNAIELFSVISTANLGTDSQDAYAMMDIKANYQVKKNWMGDPCIPKTFAWDNLMCSYSISNHARIKSLNLSSSGLSGEISTSFGRLTAIQYLNLSNNNLTGSIPDALSQLTLMKVLDLTGNQLSGSIPPGLLKRIQNDSLVMKYGNNPNLCINVKSCLPPKKKSKLAIYIAVPVVLIVVMVPVAILLFFILRRKKRGNNSLYPQNETSYVRTNCRNTDNSSLQFENRRFTYKELQKITNNFKRVLGQGGFGYVYHGLLEDGTQVAVKLRSESSNQGAREFLAEAQILSRIHHKNLVSMIGYCKDGMYMALVYEYMSEGTLQKHIAAKNNNGRYLTWRERLQIALESAKGLEYLHKGCNPPIIHRDVKSTNILLNKRMEAKIADFGLSKAFSSDTHTHISTSTLAGTPGYIDPEYQATMQPTTKSDVYSFGVVLLELTTGKPPILRDPNPISIIQWARQHLARGNIEEVVDTCLHGNYDVNGVWKATDVALKCTELVLTQRPTMADVVMQLQECLELEDKRRTVGDSYNGFFISNNSTSDPNSSYTNKASGEHNDTVSKNSSAFEADHNFGRVLTMDTGPSAR